MCNVTQKCEPVYLLSRRLKKSIPDKRNPRIKFYHLTPGSFSIHCHFLLHFKDATYENAATGNYFLRLFLILLAVFNLSFSDFGFKSNLSLIGVEQLF